MNKRQVLGSLGKPLGTLVTVEGVAANDDYRQLKIDQGKILLRIQKVDGKALKEEAIFPFEDLPFASVKKPAIGARFKYLGYETGRFVGIPQEALKHVGQATTTDHYFVTSFV
ncbi:MAG TPA: hypothetical protein VKD72_26715, partial [Gemmataceae bacterium]|nr:hypothetical protein [Gemmataceae bacterium]